MIGAAKQSNRKRWTSRHDAAVAAAICVATWLTLAGTAADVGLTYDEPVYMGYADLAAKWLGLIVSDPAAALSRSGLEAFWPAKDRQPALVKLTAAVTGPTLVALHLLPAWAAPMVWLRTGTMFWVGLALGLMYLVLRAAGLGRIASVFGPATLLFLPRVFGHSHLLALDAPAMATCFIAVAAAWWAMGREDTASVIIAGVAFGLAVSTKLNGFFVPVAVLPYALLVNPRRAGWLAVSYAGLGPALLVATWPWLWYDTAEHLRQYLAFHWRHWKIGVLYFAKVYTVAPWHYPLVMTAITTPLVPLLLCVAALGRWAQLAGRAVQRWRVGGWPAEQRLWLLAGIALAVNLAPSMLPSSPKYGGVRLFLPAFAWVAVLAALAFARVAQRVKSAVPVATERAWLVPAVLALGGLLPSVGHVAHFHPYELSFYNALIGGLPGATARGFEPTYWGETYLAAAEWLNSSAPRGAVVWIDPPGMESIMRMYKFMGRLRPDIHTVAGEEAFERADFAVSQNKPTEFSRTTKRLVRRRQPAWTERVDGVPLVFVWRLDRAGGKLRVR